MPGLSACLSRLVYMFVPALIGTRKMITYSTILYLIPIAGWFFVVQNPQTPYWALMLLAFNCGFGSGTFSGYMPSTGYFFPKRLSGTALNLQAGLGNLGMSIIQLIAPALMASGIFGVTWLAPQTTVNGDNIWAQNPALFLVPWVIVAAILAGTLLKDVPVKANIREQLDIFTNPNTWYMTVIYVMTFGLFSGLAAQFALLINNNYGAESTIQLAVSGVTYGFLGAMIGSIVRVLWGPFCDRFGGAVWTFVSAIGMAVTLGLSAHFLTNPENMSDFNGFLWSMLAMFVFAGIGNAGTFKQMPMIMPKRQSGGAIGFTAAVAALGPFIVGVGLASVSANVFFYACAIYCVICAVITWVRYARPGAPFPG